MTLDGKVQDAKFVYLYLDVSMGIVKIRLLNAYARTRIVGKEHIAMNVGVVIFAF